MWYVVQVKSGEEQEMKALLEAVKKPGAYSRCFTPLYEEVRRSAGKSQIYFRRLFPGYVFLEGDDPRQILESLREIPEFTKLLGVVEEDGSKLFIPIAMEDEKFLDTLFEDGIMHVSYIHLARTGRIDQIAGPLANYREHITKLEMRHRMAIVEAEMFGKKRRVRFGLWTDDDPGLPWVERIKGADASKDVLNGLVEFDIGIHPGDRVRDNTGVYGDQVFIVETVDLKKRTIISAFEILGTTARIELRADEVVKV